MAATSHVRSVFRSTSLKGAASRIFTEVKACRSPVTIASGRPPRLFRCPVEMTCCVELVLPHRSTTAIAWARSPISVTTRSGGWVFEGS